MLTQEELAEMLGIEQPSLPKLEPSNGMQISTQQRLIEASIAQLEFTAHLPEGDVRIMQIVPRSAWLLWRTR